MNTSCGSVVPIYRTYHTACWKKTAKGQTTANSKVTSGPKYCEGEQTTAQPGGETDSMRVMSYNLYGWNALVQNPWKAENVYKAIRQINPDLLGAQECEGMEAQVAAAIGSDYAIAGSATAGHAIIYKTSVFDFEGQGVVDLNEKDQFGLVSVNFPSSLSTNVHLRELLSTPTSPTSCLAGKLITSTPISACVMESNY